MKTEYLEKLIRRLPEFSSIGGKENVLSFPLYWENGEDSYVVHMYYSESLIVPSGFVLTPLSVGEPEVKDISESLEILGIKEDYFDGFEIEEEEPVKDISELNEYTVSSFYTLISNPDFDREIYAGYVETIMQFIKPEGRKYYRAFQSV